MEEQSLFEKLSDSQFNKYMKYFFTIVDDDFDDIREFMGMDLQMYNKIKAPIGRDLDRLDYEYLWYVLIHNRRSDILDPNINTIRPQLESKLITYTEEWVANILETRQGELLTYVGDEIDVQYLSVLKGDEWIDPFLWETKDQNIEYIDFTDDDWNID
jgi:hypothetical protein